MDSAGKLLHPAALVARWLKLLPELLAAGLAIAFTSGRSPRAFLLAGLVVIAVAGAIALVQWLRFRYWVGGSDIVIEQGVFQRRRRVIPYDRVQDIAIERPLLARLFGTARVRIETGAAAKDEGELAMVSLDDAQALRDRIRGRVPAEVEGEAVRPVEEPLLFAMGLGRVLLAGLFGFSLVFLALIAAAAQQLDQYGLVDWEDWFTEERFEAASHMVTAQVVLILAAVMVAAGLAAGVIRSLLRDFGFRLTRTENGLRRRRGLTTLSEVVIPIRRAQAAIVESGPVGRLFGWYRLSFQTLGADPKEGGTQVAAPFAKLSEILPILAEAGFPAPPPPAAFRRGPGRALVRRLPPWLLLAALGVAAALLADWRAWFAAAFFLLGAGWAASSWRAHRHAEDLEALYVTRGPLKRRLSIMPYDKLQLLSLSAGPLQRPLRLASLAVDTAGAPALRGIGLPDLDAGSARLAAARLYAAFKTARARAKAAHG